MKQKIENEAVNGSKHLYDLIRDYFCLIIIIYKKKRHVVRK